MKIVKIQMKLIVTDEYYEGDMKEWVEGLKTGVSQKELMKDAEKGIKKVTASATVTDRK